MELREGARLVRAWMIRVVVACLSLEGKLERVSYCRCYSH